jgi:hypothetical protein
MVSNQPLELYFLVCLKQKFVPSHLLPGERAIVGDLPADYDIFFVQIIALLVPLYI